MNENAVMNFKKYKPNDLKHLQQLELKILKDISSICESHDLKYYACCGTAIGAIRHGGFIPWDDDIDIVMFREDYDELLKIMDSELPDEYYLINFDKEKDCFFPMTKVCLKGTIFKITEDSVSYTEGICIDIFPLDNVPESETRRKIYYNICAIYTHLMINSIFKVKTSNKISNYAHLAIHYFLKIPGRDRVINGVRKCLTRYSGADTNYVTVHFFRIDPRGHFGKYGFLDKRDFEPYKKVKFEDIEIIMPNNYDPILTKLFGDYMTLPPEEKRYNHAPMVLDFGEY